MAPYVVHTPDKGREPVHGRPLARSLVDQASRPVWQDIAARFAEPRECLASYLALEAAEVVAGVKPANLLAIANRQRNCGRNLYTLWHQYGAAVIADCGLSVRELADRGDSVLLLIYREETLRTLVARPGAAALLGRAGYAAGAGLGQLLTELAARIDGERFPHEIGIFLGYPLKDVAGFMGLAAIPFACQGPWKIFGDPRESLRLAEIHRRCRRGMADMLACCAAVEECLQGAAQFCHVVDNECHNC